MATTQKSRTVKKPAKPDANPLDNPEMRDWLKGELADAEAEEKNGPDSQGWNHNEALRPGIEQRAAFMRALLKLLPCLLLLLALASAARAGGPLTYSDAPQTGESPSVYEARTAMSLYNMSVRGIGLSATAKVQIWDGTTPLSIGTDGSLSISVLNFPATQPVSGTFWQATQPVSAASLPLPAGAATAAKQDGMQTTLNTIAGNTTNTLSAANGFRSITATGTTTIKTGAGVLHTVCINSLGTVASVVAIYDSTTATGTKIGTINSLTLGGSFVYDVAFSNGLTIATTGVLAPDITVSYR